MNDSTVKHLEDNINVVVRVRPLNEKEKLINNRLAVKFPGDGQILTYHKTSNNSDKYTKCYTYNVVFEPNTTQEDILQYSGVKKLIEMSTMGYTCTVFCYGQTGSGKTHTLIGPPGLITKLNSYSDDHGLIFRSFVYLFKLLQDEQKINVILSASFLEIHNEKVFDLLNPGNSNKSLLIRWNKKTQTFFVENLFTVECKELDDLLAVLEEGIKNRAIGTHNINEHSSRSHTILTVNITSEIKVDNNVFISKKGKINFVDLAGSEIIKKTQSEGKTLEEANNINKSLLVLGYCIAALTDNSRKNKHIPYRDSKLTKLLADSLQGNGVTLMIACISPTLSNIYETISTLRYASRVKNIRAKPIIIMDPRESLILTLKREVSALQLENKHLKTSLNINDNCHRSYLKITDKYMETSLVNYQSLAEIEPQELSKLIQSFILENEALREENFHLYETREQILRDQGFLYKENERMIKKLEESNINNIPFKYSDMIHSEINTIQKYKRDDIVTEESLKKLLQQDKIRRENEINQEINCAIINNPSTDPKENINSHTFGSPVSIDDSDTYF